ncbi:MAG: hypothetical protein Q9188_006232, partial [Gyalolechia gomerana]
MSSAKPKVLLLGEIEQYVLDLPHHPSLFPSSASFRRMSIENVLTDSSDKARAEYGALSSLADLITPKSSNPTDFLKECRAGAFHGTKAVYRTFGSVSITGRIEGEVVEALAEAGVRFIAHNGAGYD